MPTRPIRPGIRRVLAALVLGLVPAALDATEVPMSFFALSAETLDGKPLPLSTHAGKVVLVVNTASECGFTPQYGGLETLHEQYAPKGFAVLGFPSNDFRGQEPGTNAEIAEFCRSTYGVRFPMFAKLSVKGANAHPLYRYLTGLPEPLGGDVAWNFQKYLVDRKGRVAAKFSPRTEPDDPELLRRIETLLAEKG
jgi:glutathione peroxidase